MEPANQNHRTKPLTVSEITQRIKGCLEQSFPRIWLVGEISNFKRAASGHWYFSLKDASAQIRANMWRAYTSTVKMQPKDGTEVLVSGSLSLYAPRGEYALNVNTMETLGEGRLKAEFERLKAKLMAEGLFDPANKKPLPFMPAKIGVVTSPTGAAIRDILRVLRVRFYGLHVLIFPARVQGAGAAEEIACGITYLDQHGDCDVIIAGRGGGSEEDLWAFNEEVVARAIHQAQTPIVSAVGHEVDFSISDFTADVRAATPSNAAELVIKSKSEYRQMVGLLRKTMDRSMQRRVLMLKNRVNVSERHPIFVRVRSRLNDYQRRVAELDHRRVQRVSQMLNKFALRLASMERKIHPERLARRAEFFRVRLDRATENADRKIHDRLEDGQTRFAALVGRLRDLSPLRTLLRGYAVVRNSKNKVVRGPEDVKIGEVLDVKLANGELRTRVIEPQQEAVQEDLF